VYGDHLLPDVDCDTGRHVAFHHKGGVQSTAAGRDAGDIAGESVYGGSRFDNYRQRDRIQHELCGRLVDRQLCAGNYRRDGFRLIANLVVGAPNDWRVRAAATGRDPCHNRRRRSSAAKRTDNSMKFCHVADSEWFAYTLQDRLGCKKRQLTLSFNPCVCMTEAEDDHPLPVVRRGSVLRNPARF